jgi:CSLREA domain-containing protein
MGSTRPLTATAVLVLAALGVAGAATPASALPATIVVDTWEDELNADGDCSLREAVQTIETAAPVDACAVPDEAVIEVPAGLEALGSTLVVSQSMTIRGAAAVPSSISCSFVVGNCIENAGAGSDLHLENLWVDMASGIQVYAAPGAGDLSLRDVNVWGGTSGVVSQGGEISMVGSTVWDTTGWGVFSLNGDVTIDHATLGGHDEGAVYGDLADISISSTAIYQNEGAGVFGQSGDVEIVTSTIADNGGEAARTHDGSISLRSATVVDNLRSVYVSGPGEARLTNTVVAGSTANCAGTVESDGFNVSDDLTCAFGQATDRNGIDPGLAPFDNTALSPSARPLEGSPLIDTGGECGGVDQLDAVRPTDGDDDGEARCDIGAVEVPGDLAPTNPTDDPTDPDSPLPAAPATAVAARPTFTG